MKMLPRVSKIAPLALACAAAMLPLGASANLLTNGNFDAFAGPWNGSGGNYHVVSAGDSTTIAGWLVGGTSVDLIQNAYGTISGVSVDLSGSPGPGSISQSFAAIANYTYTLAWDYFKNGGGTQLDVTFGGVTTSFAPPSVVTSTSLTWTPSSSGLSTITFAGLTGNNGPVVDNIILTAVPEPGAMALALAGLGVVGWARRRKAG